MTTSPPRIPDSGTAPRCASMNSLSPPKKLFLALSVLLLGATFAIAQARSPIDLCSHSTLDLALVSAPLPASGASKSAPDFVPEKELSLSAVSSQSVFDLPQLSAGPTVDQGMEKYAQTYPAPILVEQAPPVLEKKKLSPVDEVRRKTGTTLTPSKFETIHQFNTIAAPSVKPSKKAFKEVPESIDCTQKMDQLLPLFHFAGNFKPIRSESVPQEMPNNPFQSQTTTIIDVSTTPEQMSDFSEIINLSELVPLNSQIDDSTPVLVPLKNW